MIKFLNTIFGFVHTQSYLWPTLSPKNFTILSSLKWILQGKMLAAGDIFASLRRLKVDLQVKMPAAGENFASLWRLKGKWIYNGPPNTPIYLS